MSKLVDILPVDMVYASSGPDGEPTGTDLNADKRQQIKTLVLELIEKAKETSAPLTNLTKWIGEL